MPYASVGGHAAWWQKYELIFHYGEWGSYCVLIFSRLKFLFGLCLCYDCFPGVNKLLELSHSEKQKAFTYLIILLLIIFFFYVSVPMYDLFFSCKCMHVVDFACEVINNDNGARDHLS